MNALRGDLRKEMRLLSEQLMGEIARLRVRVEEELVVVHQQMEEMKEDRAWSTKPSH